MINIAMLATVPLPEPLVGDSSFPPANRNNPIPEPRKLQRFYPESIRSYHSENKNQSSSQIRSKIDAISNFSESLRVRLQNLKSHLDILKSKSGRILDEIFKEPPDPDPSDSPGSYSNVVFNEAHEGREESTPKILHARLELQVLKGSNLRSEGDCFCIQESTLKGGGIGLRFHHSIFYQSNHHSNLHPRCSSLCPMATDRNQTELALAEKMNALPRNGVGCLSEGVHRRAGKEAAESSKDGGKCVLVVDMAGARELQRPRFLAVGLFLSVLLVNSKQLIEHMKRVWKVRGDMEASAIESEFGRKFIIHFSEQGDWKHAIVGGPWQYKGDAFLVEGLAAGADPSSALFTHVPMWVQFRNIPFYLLTKKLAHDLGECIGTTLKIDDNARGSLDDKFIRTRIQLPLYKALQRSACLMRLREEVVAQVRYERLPNFCLFCGFIGHMEARCDMPKEGRKIMFSLDLRVRAVHFEDPRRWFLPNKMGKTQQHPPPLQLWRAPEPVEGEHGMNSVFGAVNLVQEVAKLSVVDKSTPVTGPGDSVEDELSSSNVKQNVSQGNEQALEDESTETTNAKKMRTWKRKEKASLREHNNGSSTPITTQLAGSVRGREVTQDEDMEVEPASKKSTIQVSTQSESLGKEVLENKKEEENAEAQTDGSELNDSGKEKMGSTGGKAATGPGATGNLSGANVSARQEP